MLLASKLGFSIPPARGAATFSSSSLRPRARLSPCRSAGARVFDGRWAGAHGIGRFASEIRTRLHGFEPLPLKGQPSNPLDSIGCSAWLYWSKPRLYFTPGCSPPLGSPCPFVFCVHDLMHLRLPGETSAMQRAFYRGIVRRGAHEAAAVLTVSEYSRDVVSEWAGVPADRVFNVGKGVSGAFTPEGPVYRAEERPYFLHVGADRPHKNIPTILEAFAASGLAGAYRLVLTTRPSIGLRVLIERFKLARSVRFVRAADDGVLATLYRGAVGLVSPSLYEGFGLPMIEAMACGTPVIASNVTAMPEICRGAALLVSPQDVGEIADALLRLADDRLLRGTLIRRGLARAQCFTWERTAGKVAEVLACV